MGKVKEGSRVQAKEKGKEADTRESHIEEEENWSLCKIGTHNINGIKGNKI